MFTVNHKRLRTKRSKLIEMLQRNIFTFLISTQALKHNSVLNTQKKSVIKIYAIRKVNTIVVKRCKLSNQFKRNRQLTAPLVMRRILPSGCRTITDMRFLSLVNSRTFRISYACCWPSYKQAQPQRLPIIFTNNMHK